MWYIFICWIYSVVCLFHRLVLLCLFVLAVVGLLWDNVMLLFWRGASSACSLVLCGAWRVCGALPFPLQCDSPPPTKTVRKYPDDALERNRKISSEWERQLLALVMTGKTVCAWFRWYPVYSRSASSSVNTTENIQLRLKCAFEWSHLKRGAEELRLRHWQFCSQLQFCTLSMKNHLIVSSHGTVLFNMN